MDCAARRFAKASSPEASRPVCKTSTRSQASSEASISVITASTVTLSYTLPTNTPLHSERLKRARQRQATPSRKLLLHGAQDDRDQVRLATEDWSIERASHKASRSTSMRRLEHDVVALCARGEVLETLRLSWTSRCRASLVTSRRGGERDQDRDRLGSVTDRPQTRDLVERECVARRAFIAVDRSVSTAVVARHARHKRLSRASAPSRDTDMHEQSDCMNRTARLYKLYSRGMPCRSRPSDRSTCVCVRKTMLIHASIVSSSCFGALEARDVMAPSTEHGQRGSRGRARNASDCERKCTT